MRSRPATSSSARASSSRWRCSSSSIPTTAGLAPLVKKDGMPYSATRLAGELRPKSPVFYDESGAIAARYRTGLIVEHREFRAQLGGELGRELRHTVLLHQREDAGFRN